MSARVGVVEVSAYFPKALMQVKNEIGMDLHDDKQMNKDQFASNLVSFALFFIIYY